MISFLLTLFSRDLRIRARFHFELSSFLSTATKINVLNVYSILYPLFGNQDVKPHVLNLRESKAHLNIGRNACRILRSLKIISTRAIIV